MTDDDMHSVIVPDKNVNKVFPVHLHRVPVERVDDDMCDIINAANDIFPCGNAADERNAFACNNGCRAGVKRQDCRLGANLCRTQLCPFAKLRVSPVDAVKKTECDDVFSPCLCCHEVPPAVKRQRFLRKRRALP